MCKQDCFIKSGCVGIIYCQGTIDIGSGNFSSYRHSITVGPPPGRGADTQSYAYIKIVPHCEGIDGDSIIQCTECKLNRSRCLICQRTHIDILAIAMLFYKLNCDPAQVIN